MKSWTRTLNLDDAHTLLALATPGMACADWTRACHEALPVLSMPRRRELVRILRDQFLEIAATEPIVENLFLKFYTAGPALGQIDLVAAQWALSHEIGLLAAEQIARPALERGETEIPLARIDRLVGRYLETSSAESIRKTRTVLVGALEGVGSVVTRGTGQHHHLAPGTGRPHALAFGYLVHRDLRDRGLDAMMASEVIESSLPVRLTLCDAEWATRCVAWNVRVGFLEARGDEIGRARPRPGRSIQPGVLAPTRDR